MKGRGRKGLADPTLAMTPAPTVPALVRRGGLALAAAGLMACGSDEGSDCRAPADCPVHTGGAGGVAPMVPLSGGAPMTPYSGGAPMIAPMPPMINPGSGGAGSGGAPMAPPSGGAPMFPPYGSGGLPFAGAPMVAPMPPMVAPMPPMPPMPAPRPASPSGKSG